MKRSKVTDEQIDTVEVISMRAIAMRLEPMPWPMLLAVAACWLCGFWPATHPDHYREFCLRYVPHSLSRYVFSPGEIRAFAILYLVLVGVGLVAGVNSRF